MAGLVAFTNWQIGVEPDGWDRHPITGRYRLDGDTSCEYWKDDDCNLHAVGPNVEIVKGEPRRK